MLLRKQDMSNECATEKSPKNITDLWLLSLFALPCIIYVICAVSGTDSDNAALCLGAKYCNVIVTVALTLFSQLFHIK